MERAEHRVTLSSGDVWYHVRGTGRPVVHLHPGVGVCPSPVLDGLATSFAVYQPVVPGFDETPVHNGVTSMHALATLMGEFIDTVIGENCDVVGYSFGGNLAAWLAVNRPERIEHLVLEAPFIVLPEDHAEPSGLTGAHRALLERYERADAELIAQLAGCERPTLILQGTLDRIVPPPACSDCAGAAVSVSRLRVGRRSRARKRSARTGA